MVKNILLFGVPNDPDRELPMGHLVPMVCDESHGEKIPDPLRGLPSHLADIDQNFIEIVHSKQIELISYYEIVGSQTVKVS